MYFSGVEPTENWIVGGRTTQIRGREQLINHFQNGRLSVPLHLIVRFRRLLRLELLGNDLPLIAAADVRYRW